MELQKDALIVTHAGQEVGRLDRVAINPRSKEVTHLVVRKGTLLPVDKVIEMSLVDQVTAERITLRPEAGDPQFLPVFEVKHYVATQDPALLRGGIGRTYAPKGYWYTPAGDAGGLPVRGIPNSPLPLPKVPPAGREVEQQLNIPDSTVALKEGARVLAEDGTQLGSIVRLFAEEGTGRATHFLVSKGLLHKEQKVIPMDWVGQVTEDTVQLAVGADVVADLHNYEEVNRQPS